MKPFMIILPAGVSSLRSRAGGPFQLGSIEVRLPSKLCTAPNAERMPESRPSMIERPAPMSQPAAPAKNP